MTATDPFTLPGSASLIEDLDSKYQALQFYSKLFDSKLFDDQKDC